MGQRGVAEGELAALLAVGWCLREGCLFWPVIRQLRLRAAAPAMTSASASASAARSRAPVRMCSPNKNTPSRLAAEALALALVIAGAAALSRSGLIAGDNGHPSCEHQPALSSAASAA